MQKFSSTYIAFTLFVVMIVHASFRGSTSDLDAIVYAGFLKELSTISTSEFINLLIDNGLYFKTREDSLARFEIGFAILAWCTTLGGYNLSFSFFIISLLSLLPKFYILKNRVQVPALGALWYLATCYPLLEMNAIRAGLATGVIFCSIIYIEKKSYFKFVLSVLLASTIHISALVGFSLVFLSKNQSVKEIINKFCVISLIAYATIYFVINAEVMDFLPKINEYKAELDHNGLYSKINIVNLNSILLIAPFFLFLKLKTVVLNNQNNLFFIAIYLLPFSMLLSLSLMPIVSLRVFEFMYVFSIFLISIPKGLFILNKRTYMWSIVIMSIILLSLQQFRVQNANLLYFLVGHSSEMKEYYDLKIGSDRILYELWLEGL